MSRRDLSSAEYTVLGLIWREGPCTTYAVMLKLASSPSSFFRKRASSTYSEVQKLLKRGFVEPAGDGVGTRGDRQIAITAAGLKALREWLSPPVPPLDAAYSNDLIRLRMNFLGALEPADQLAFVEDALRLMRGLALEYERAIEERGHESHPIAIVGILYETRARIAWLEYVRTVLPIPSPTA